MTWYSLLVPSSSSNVNTSLWLPATHDAARVLTSATLETGASDRVGLYVRGELVVEFEVASGFGEALLRECGLERRA